jgi:hypothetical protein
MPRILPLSLLAVMLVVPGQAGAVDARVQAACANDYLTYCSRHDPEGPGVRRCMQAVGPRLTPACVNALIAAGEVSRTEVARRARANGR